MVGVGILAASVVACGVTVDAEPATVEEPAAAIDTSSVQMCAQVEGTACVYGVTAAFRCEAGAGRIGTPLRNPLDCTCLTSNMLHCSR